jgi:hypothetical protein
MRHKTRAPFVSFTSVHLLHLDYHVTTHGGRSAPASPASTSRKSINPKAVPVFAASERHNPRPGCLGQNPVRPRCVCTLTLKHVFRLPSFQFSASRPHTMLLLPSSTLPTRNHTLTSSTSASSRSKSSFFAPCRALPAKYSSFSISHSGGPRMMLGWDMS